MKSFMLMGVAAAALMFGAVGAEAAKAKSKPPSEASLECSARATAQGLIGKEHKSARKAFRAKCLRELSKKAA